MIRICRRNVVRVMAGVAYHRRAGIPRCVTACATRGFVQSKQREFSLVVIKRRRFPRRCAVALCAVCREPGV